MATPIPLTSCFTGEQIDYDRDFRCRRGELVIVKKPKGISSHLKVTGEFAMVRDGKLPFSLAVFFLLTASRSAFNCLLPPISPSCWDIDGILSGISQGAMETVGPASL